jgi:serine/threonine protein kinase
MPSTAPQLKTIFGEALEIESPADRAAFMERACGGDASLRAGVDALLQAHQEAGRFLDPAGVLPSPETPGTVIGPYKLLEQIGEGGMGLVFMAEQTAPVRRKVALKLLKPGMDTRQVVARFEAERQALALMDHPHIAKVFNAGTTSAGRPFFVMELVKGVPITEFCDQRRLTTRQRLELFALVCQAVQHAHQKGIIHRDLKPSNVLVTLHDVTPVPKVIDFGIAKAAGQQLTERTLFTQFAQMVGTPLYMSPEQAEMNGLDVDTRSDVYALGVLLYELLTGTTPFAGETLKKAGLDELRRMIREEDPPTPSQRLHALGAAACSTVSERRGVDGRRLGQQLRGELDWIVMRALEKDRDRRYESASAFAADIQRYLNDEAVAACPPSAGYRLRKYVRRNRRALVTAGVIAAALITATAVSIWQAARATEAQYQAEADRKQAEADRKQAETDRDRAKTAEGEAKTNLKRSREAEQCATTEAAIAQAVNRFLQDDLLRQAHRSAQAADMRGGNPDLTVREALDRAAAGIDQRFRDQPLVEAAIRIAISDAYASLRWHTLAVPHVEKAVALRRANLGIDHPETLCSMEALAGIYEWVGRSRDAVALKEEILEVKERQFGPDHSATIDSAAGLAEACRVAGQGDRAVTLGLRVLEKRRAVLGSSHAATVDAMFKLAMIYLAAGRFEESIAWCEKVLEVPGDTAWQLKTYGKVLQRAGRLDEADHQLRKVLEIEGKRSDRRERELRVALVQDILGLNLLLQGRYPEAESMSREALAYWERETPDCWDRFHAMSMVGGALMGQHKYAGAERFLVQGYEGMKQREALIIGDFKPWLTQAGERLIRFYEATNQPEKARAWREKLSPEKLSR